MTMTTAPEANTAHQADASTEETTSTTITTAACSSNHRSPIRCLQRGEHQNDEHHCGSSSNPPHLPIRCLHQGEHQHDGHQLELQLLLPRVCLLV
jgi:hypothetical protein